MRFSTLDELLEYVKGLDADAISEYDIRFTRNSETIVESNAPLKSTIKIMSLSDGPEVEVSMDATLVENVLYVDEYNSIPNACSTGKVKFMGREIYTNICEDDSGSVIYLNLSLNENSHHNVPFRFTEVTR